MHVWTADTPTKEQRAAWIANLDKIAARKPAVVVPGHMAVDAATDLSGVDSHQGLSGRLRRGTRQGRGFGRPEAAMKARFPGLGMGVALDIGAKVATGEMKWG